MDRRYRIPGGQRDDLTAPKEKNGVGDDQQRISLEVNQGSKCLFDLLAVAGFQNMVSAPTSSALARSRTRAANAPSISCSVLAFRTRTCRPMTRAARCASLSWVCA